MQTRTFSCPAKYRRFVEAQLALALAEVKRDADRREDEDARVQRLATVPDQFLDPTATGRCSIIVHMDSNASLPTTPEAKSA